MFTMRFDMRAPGQDATARRPVPGGDRHGRAGRQPWLRDGRRLRAPRLRGRVLPVAVPDGRGAGRRDHDHADRRRRRLPAAVRPGPIGRGPDRHRPHQRWPGDVRPRPGVPARRVRAARRRLRCPGPDRRREAGRAARRAARRPRRQAARRHTGTVLAGRAASRGGATNAAARRAGRNGVGFFAQTDVGDLQATYEQAARDAGHEPGLCILPSPNALASVFVNDDLDLGWAEVGEALLQDAVPYFQWNEEAGSADYTASLSRAQTVEDLRKEGARTAPSPWPRRSTSSARTACCRCSPSAVASIPRWPGGTSVGSSTTWSRGSPRPAERRWARTSASAGTRGHEVPGVVPHDPADVVLELVDLLGEGGRLGEPLDVRVVGAEHHPGGADLVDERTSSSSKNGETHTCSRKISWGVLGELARHLGGDVPGASSSAGAPPTPSRSRWSRCARWGSARRPCRRRSMPWCRGSDWPTAGA